MNPAAFAAVGIYAALNVLILVCFIAATSRLRYRHGVLIGDGGQKHLTRVMRGHANATENMPMTFVLLLVAAALGAPAVALHALGATFTLGRAIHAVHFIRERAPTWQRALGFTLSLLATLAAAVAVLGHAFVVLLAG